MPLSEGDLELTLNKTGHLLFGSFLGGVVGAMGLGGAVVFNPTLIALGVVPQVVSATSMYLIMYT